eukprot:GFYU01043832.1.p1 GENE.GFYU01043832.1~~GFYU01043832.1.p1  ORF type:complete len:135 (-),score=14.80 GFYU01043832.1:5-409(-)
MMSLGASSERMLMDSGLGSESIDRVRELSMGFRRRLLAQEEEAVARREKSAVVQNVLNALVSDEVGAREGIYRTEHKGYEKLSRVYDEYRNYFLNETAKNEQRARYDEWRDLQIRKLEQEKYRQMHATLLKQHK